MLIENNNAKYHQNKWPEDVNDMRWAALAFWVFFSLMPLIPHLPSFTKVLMGAKGQTFKYEELKIPQKVTFCS